MWHQQSDEVAPQLTFDHGCPITLWQLLHRLGAFAAKRAIFRDDPETYEGYIPYDVADQATTNLPLYGPLIPCNNGNSVTPGGESANRSHIKVADGRRSLAKLTANRLVAESQWECADIQA